MKKKKKFNEEFMKPYEGSSLITQFDVDEKAHVELGPELGYAMQQAKKVRDQIKDDFKDQDKMADEFIKEYELEEKPELPKDLDNKEALKDMKLAESMLTEADLEKIEEDYLDEPTPEDSLKDKVADYLEEKIMGFITDQLPAMQLAADIPEYDVEYCSEEPTSNTHRAMLKVEFLVEKVARTLLNIYFSDFLRYEPKLLESETPMSEEVLKEASLEDMIHAFEAKIDELEGTNESLEEATEDTPEALEESAEKYVLTRKDGDKKVYFGQKGQLVSDKKDAMTYDKEYLDNLKQELNPGWESEKLNESVELTEDYSNFIGKPLKDFLFSIPRNTKINIDYGEPDDGCSGINGRVNQVPFSVADRIIKDIQLGDENYYKFKVLTEATEEDKKKDLTEARKVSKFSYDDDDESHRYKVVAADPDSKELFVKDVKGLGKVDKVLADLTDEKLNSMGASQVYVTRDDDKEVYLKFGNEDGTWDVIQDDRDMEKPAEERDTTFNHIMADLNAESTPDQKALRLMPRKGEGYVGFEDDEIGFNEDEEVIHLKSQSDKPINWAKKVAEFYGYKTSEVTIGQNNYKFIDIFVPGIVDETKLA